MLLGASWPVSQTTEARWRRTGKYEPGVREGTWDGEEHALLACTSCLEPALQLDRLQGPLKSSATFTVSPGLHCNMHTLTPTARGAHARAAC